MALQQYYHNKKAGEEPFSYGFNGRAQVTAEDGVTFDFKNSRKSTWLNDFCPLHEIFYIKQ